METAAKLRGRLAIGAGQGLALWLIMLLAAGPGASSQPLWAPAHPMPVAILFMLATFLPLQGLAAFGRLRGRSILRYLLVSAASLAALAAYDIWRDPASAADFFRHARAGLSSALLFCTLAGVFIANQLLEHRARGEGFYAAYADHFEDSWMRAFQFFLAAVFALLVWAILLLGALMFRMIGVGWFGALLRQPWFSLPVTTIAFAAAVHITDIRPALLKGMRNLGLTLLGWLLPLIVALTALFLASLPFTGLAPLWRTRHAASLLLWTSAVLLVLVNAAYKDGDPANAPHPVPRLAGRAAGPLMLVLVLLAADAIAQRVAAEGWTPARIDAACTAFVGLLYAAGYSWAALRGTPWLKRLETVNVSASFVILGVLVLLHSPLGDPARISVASQVARLQDGRVAPDKFDYGFLAQGAGRFGRDALRRLASPHPGGPATPPAQAAAIAKQAQRAMEDPARLAGGATEPEQAEPPFSHATIYPKGAILPPDFASKAWDSASAPLGQACLRNGAPCDIVLLGTPQDAAHEILVYRAPETDRSGTGFAVGTASVFGRDETGAWRVMGWVDGVTRDSTLAALRAGKALPARPLQDDVLAGSMRLVVRPDVRTPPCR